MFLGSAEQRIDLRDAEGLKEWAGRLNATEAQIRYAVNHVGPSVRDVRNFLRDLDQALQGD
ncbi:MAG TPA: DUF3606 domain-containing protein [Burkholderiales bacterium]|nr:DUF3606 domain-containing protein [Burkholderiales bacterium]